MFTEHFSANSTARSEFTFRAHAAEPQNIALQASHLAERGRIQAVAIEDRLATGVAHGGAVGTLAAGEEAAVALGIAAHVNADMVNLRTVANIGIEEHQIARCYVIAGDFDARRVAGHLVRAARNG